MGSLMYKEITYLAIIPARSGSKRLPGKNIRELSGKPLIQWTIDSAKESGVFDLIVVSSDDENILEYANNSSVQAMSRPSVYSTDTSSTFDVIQHVLLELEAEGYIPEYTVLLQPTSPLRTAKDITDAIKYLNETCSDSIISVCETEHSPLWCNTLDDENNMGDFLLPVIKNKRSQDLPVYYRLNGAIFLAKTKNLLVQKTFFMDNTKAYIMDKLHSIDIDSNLDFLYAETILKSISKKNDN